MNNIIPFVSRKSLAHQAEWLEMFAALLPDDSVELVKDIKPEDRARCEFAIVLDPDPQELELFSNLKWLQSLWAGVESLVPLAKKQNLQLIRMIDPKLTETMAEAVLAWTLYLHRLMPSYANQQQNKQWLQLPYKPAEHCTVAILGLGELGQASARKLNENGFNLLGWSKTQKSLDNIECFSGEQGLVDMTKRTDILICLLPLTYETTGIINQSLLEQLPNDASLINFARGPHVVEDDLLAVLNQGHLYHAVLDVYQQEPLPANNALWSHPKITILPHIAATSYPQTAAEIAAKNISYYRSTGKLANPVNLTRGY